MEAREGVLGQMPGRILADALDSDFATEVDPEMLLSGARSASSIGLGRACFMVRTLGQFWAVLNEGPSSS